MRTDSSRRALHWMIGGGIVLLLGLALFTLFLFRKGYVQQQESFEELAVVSSSPTPIATNGQSTLPTEAELEEERKTPSTFEGEIVLEASGAEQARNNLFELQAVSSERTTLDNTELGEEEEFLVVRLQITNVSGATRTLIPLAELLVSDDQGREYTVALLEQGSLEQNLDGYQSVEPSQTLEGELAFVVLKESNELTLEYRNRNMGKDAWLVIRDIEEVE